MGRDRLSKEALLDLLQKSSFNTAVEFGRDLGKIYATLYLRQLCFMIRYLKIWNVVWWSSIVRPK